MAYSSIHKVLDVHSLNHWLLNHTAVLAGLWELDLVVTSVIDSVIGLINFGLVFDSRFLMMIFIHFGEARCEHRRLLVLSHFNATIILLVERYDTALVLEALGHPDDFFSIALLQISCVAAHWFGVL